MLFDSSNNGEMRMSRRIANRGSRQTSLILPLLCKKIFNILAFCHGRDLGSGRAWQSLDQLSSSMSQ